MVKETGKKVIAQNKKGRHDYFVDETFECGIVLQGTEVKSLREGRASLTDGFAMILDGELWLHGVHIPEYTEGSWTNHTPRRDRKLLMHRAEINKLAGKLKQGGNTLIPLSIYFKDGKVKVLKLNSITLRYVRLDRRYIQVRVVIYLRLVELKSPH